MAVRHILLAVFVAAIWGVSFVAIRWGVDEVPPLLLTALRYAMAAVPAVFFVRRPLVPLPILAGYGLAIGVGQFGLLFVAIRLGLPAGLASLVVQLQVFFTIGLAALLFGERPALSHIAGAFIAAAGIGVIAFERVEGTLLLPLVLTVLAALFWGLGNTASKKAGRIDMLGFIVWSSLVPPLPLLAASLVFEGPSATSAAIAEVTWRGLGSLAFMSYAATLFGFGAWAMLLNRYPASAVAPFALFVPVFGIGAGVLLLGESVTALEIAGGALVFAGLLVNVLGPRLLARKPAAP